VIIEECVKRGFAGKGMPTFQWIGASETLGLKLEELQMTKVLRSNRIYKGDKCFWYPTLAQVLQQYPKGVYFVRIKGHALVIRDGRVIDPNMGKGKTRATVYNVWKIHNPAEPKLGTKIKFFKAPTGRKGATLDRRRQAFFYIRNCPNWSERDSLPMEEVFANTSYTRKDFENDFRKGLVTLVD
jgi:hypothetical protein